MFIEISTIGIVAIFFGFLFLAFIRGLEHLSLSNTGRVKYVLIYGAILLALLAVLVAVDFTWYM